MSDSNRDNLIKNLITSVELADKIDQINDLDIIYLVPDGNYVKRSWRDRLFSLPWKPWVKKSWVENPNKLGGLGIFKKNNSLFCNKENHKKLVDLYGETMINSKTMYIGFNNITDFII